MSKVRVYQLAKELGTSSKKLIEVMEDMDIKVNNHMSTLTDEEAKKVMSILTGKTDEKKPEETKQASGQKTAEKEKAGPKPAEEAAEKKKARDKGKEKAGEQEQKSLGRKARKMIQEEKRAAMLKAKSQK